MNYKLLSGSFILVFSFTLAACKPLSRDIQTIPVESHEKNPLSNEQIIEIEKCEKLKNLEPSNQFGYVNNKDLSKKGSWHSVKDINENDEVSKEISLWPDELVHLIAIELSPPSGDWVRYDDYCFNKAGEIVKLDSDLRTYYGHVKILRNWIYSSTGSLINSNIKIFDLETDKLVKPDTSSYMDNPPYITKNEADLFKHFEIQKSLLKNL